jgi:[ribosomal protein S5]-alanine N-acetyltransferase
VVVTTDSRAEFILKCGDSLSLRAPRLSDAESLAKHANDRDVWINLRDRMPHPYSAKDALQWLRTVERQDPRTTFIIDRNGEAVGGIGLALGTDIERCSAEVGYWLGKEFWGRGIVTMALRRICEYAFDELGLTRVFATPLAWNPASFRVLEKTGFQREGIMRSACIKDGAVTDVALYAKVKVAEPDAGTIEKWFPIRTERLMLREFVATDESDVHEYASDPIVSRFTDWGPNTPEVTVERMSIHLQEQQIWPRDEVSLAVELCAENKLIGTIRIGIFDRRNRLADFGFVLNRRYWNRGYATEASGALLDTAFSVLRLHRVIATCDTRNVASSRVMEKAGMRREGFFRRDVFQKGEWRDSYLYARLETDAPL